MNRQQYGPDYYEIVIEMKKPCTVLKLLPKMRAVVRSPFNFNLQQSHNYAYPCDRRYIDEDFMTNYWNVNQCFLIQGTSSKRQIEMLMTKIEESNPYIKIIYNKEL